MGFFCTGDLIFATVYLCGYCELEALPQHNSDVFFVGNPFPIELRVFGHYMNRLQYPNVARPDREFAVIHLNPMANQ